MPGSRRILIQLILKIEQNLKFLSIKGLVALNSESPLTQGRATCTANEITRNINLRTITMALILSSILIIHIFI